MPKGEGGAGFLLFASLREAQLVGFGISVSALVVATPSNPSPQLLGVKLQISLAWAAFARGHGHGTLMMQVARGEEAGH